MGVIHDGVKVYPEAIDVLTNLNKLISEHLIVLTFVFIISFISLYLYDTDDRYNNRSKNDFSMSLFRFISKFIHMTTVIIICDSLFIDNFLVFF